MTLLDSTSVRGKADEAAATVKTVETSPRLQAGKRSARQSPGGSKVRSHSRSRAGRLDSKILGVSGGSHAAPARGPGPGLLLALVVLAALVAGGFWWSTRLPTPRAQEPAAAPGGGSGSAALTGTVPDGTTDGRVSLGDDGSARVSLILTFAKPVDRLDLSVPARRGAAADTNPRLSALSVEADGRAVEAPERPEPGHDATVELVEPSTRVVIAYTATGVTLHTTPAQPTRALALVTPVVVAQAEGSPWRVSVDSVKVRNLGCAGNDGMLVSCGTAAGATWTAEGSGDEGRTDVLAQLDLPVS